MDARQLKSKTLTDKSSSPVKRDTNPKSGDHLDEHEIVHPEEIVQGCQEKTDQKQSTDEIDHPEEIVQGCRKKETADLIVHREEIVQGCRKKETAEKLSTDLVEVYKRLVQHNRREREFYQRDRRSTDVLGNFATHSKNRCAVPKESICDFRAYQRNVSTLTKKDLAISITPYSICATVTPAIPTKQEPQEKVLSYSTSKRSVNKKPTCFAVPIKIHKQKPVKRTSKKLTGKPGLAKKAKKSSCNLSSGDGSYLFLEVELPNNQTEYLELETSEKAIQCKLSPEETKKREKRIICDLPEPFAENSSPAVTEQDKVEEMLCNFKDLVLTDKPSVGAELLPQVHAVAEEIEKTEFYRKLMEEIRNLVLNPIITSDALEDQIRNLVVESGYKEKLRSSVYQAITKFPSVKNKVPQKKEPLEYVQKTQATWEQRISKSLNNMSSDLGIPFSRKRPVSEQIEFEAKWSELGSEDMDLSRFRPVYSPKDFLEVLVNMKNSNVCAPPTPDQGAPTYWGLIKVPLKVKTFHEMKIQFEELSGNIDHLGLNILPFSTSEFSNNCLKERVSLGRRVLEANQAVLAREFCKRGCPATLRAELWSLILGVEITGSHRLNFKHLKSCVFQHDLLIDKLIFKELSKHGKVKLSMDFSNDLDIHLTASNDDQYFVFEDLLYQILLVFSRDTSILSHFDNSSSSPPKAMLRSSHSSVPYPPNGVIPFHGFSMLVAPLCYIYEDPITLYYIFRELYIRYFFRLHNVSSHPQGALSLALLFETILDEMEPQLAYHFHKHDIQPLKIAMKWIVKAFSGSLAVDQILQLWDCVLAYDSTEIIIVLAVGIFSFRKNILLQAENQATVENILADISAIKVIPLLHGMLANSHQHRHAPNTSSR